MKACSLGESIIDSDIQENLGTIDPIKAYLRIIHIYPKLCVCENSEREERPMTDDMSTFTKIAAGLNHFTKNVSIPTQPQPLNINEADATGGWIEGSDLQIKLGDLARPKRI